MPSRPVLLAAHYEKESSLILLNAKIYHVLSISIDGTGRAESVGRDKKPAATEADMIRGLHLLSTVFRPQEGTERSTGHLHEA